MLTNAQRRVVAEFVADERCESAGGADEYVGEVDETRDVFAGFVDPPWVEAVGKTLTIFAGYPAVHYERVQARKGDRRYELFVVDFGDARGIYQI